MVEMLVSLLTSHLRRKIRCWFPVMGNTRKDFIKVKGFKWMEVWADFILECQILSQTSNLYLTVQGSGVGMRTRTQLQSIPGAGISQEF